MDHQLEQWIEELFKDTDTIGKMTEKQQRIVEAAIEIFAEKGYAAASTSEIAQKAGVAEGTIFRHYKTKKDLLLSIVAPVMTRLIGPLILRDFAKMLDQPYDTYEDFLRALFRNRYIFAKDNMSIIKIFLQEVPFHDELKENLKTIFEDIIITRFCRIVDGYKGKGQLSNDLPTPAIIRFTITSMLGLLMTLVLVIPEKGLDENEELEHTICMIMRGIGSME